MSSLGGYLTFQRFAQRPAFDIHLKFLTNDKVKLFSKTDEKRNTSELLKQSPIAQTKNLTFVNINCKGLKVIFNDVIIIVRLQHCL